MDDSRYTKREVRSAKVIREEIEGQLAREIAATDPEEEFRAWERREMLLSELRSRGVTDEGESAQSEAVTC